MTAAGRLRERITFQQRADDTRDALGSQSAAWSDVATVWAQHVPAKGDEVPVTGQMVVQTPATFVIRYRTGLLETMRVVWRSVNHEIVSLTSDVRRESITVQCIQGVRDGR